ncbi:MAG: hypothetical protein FWD34_08695 [Oscillospiraceae bacterium]|nr:hypothetical protein [Oscillospiraceae bacterium]
MKKVNPVERLMSKKGSVLFVVLILMSVMIILASALFYFTTSKRAVVVTEYTEIQAYETALNMLDMITNTVLFVDDGTGSSFNDFYEKSIQGMLNGGSPVQAVLRSEELGGTLPGGFGDEVIVDIYSIDKGDDMHDVVIRVTVNYGGKTVSLTRTLGVRGREAPPAPFVGFSKVIASTGYNGGHTNAQVPGAAADIHFDYKDCNHGDPTAPSTCSTNRPTIRAFHTDVKMYGNVSSAKCLTLLGTKHYTTPASGAKQINVWHNLLLAYDDAESKHYVVDNGVSSTDPGIIRVGGNLTIGQGSGTPFGNNIVVYVFGDLIYNDGSTRNATYYVMGNVISSLSEATLSTIVRPMNACVNSRADLNDKVFNGQGCSNMCCVQYKLLWEAAMSPCYRDWDLTSTRVGTNRQKVLDWSNTRANDDSNNASSFNLSNGDTITAAGRPYVFYINESCNITAVECFGTLPDGNNGIFTVIIDTGFGANKKDIYVTLGTPGVSSLNFRWRASNMTENRFKIWVLTVGDGNVIFDIPDNINYVMGGPLGTSDKTRDAVMPYNMALAPGQNCWDNSNSNRGASWIETNFQNTGMTRFLNAITGFQCRAGAVSCASFHAQKDGKCDGFMNLRTDLGSWQADATPTTKSNVCTSSDIQNLFGASQFENITIGTGNGAGMAIRPGGINNNIFFVTMGKLNSITIGEGAFMSGFIYAPYSKYVFDSNEAQGVALYGGMIVSSFVAKSKFYYMGVQPNNDEFLRILTANMGNCHVHPVPPGPACDIGGNITPPPTPCGNSPSCGHPLCTDCYPPVSNSEWEWIIKSTGR